MLIWSVLIFQLDIPKRNIKKIVLCFRCMKIVNTLSVSWEQYSMAHCPSPPLLSESSSRTGLILVDVGWVHEEVKESAFVYLYFWTVFLSVNSFWIM